MDTELRRYLNAILVLLSIIIGTMWARTYMGPPGDETWNVTFTLFALVLAFTIGLVIYVIFGATRTEWNSIQREE